jgi:LysR family hydrogen peroxide-inducible transcriptional activator
LTPTLNFSLTQIEYALAMHPQGNFSAAAKQCHVTQPTLSMQIQKLEDELGTVLFDRSKKPILLTEKGRLLIDQMQSVVFEAKKIDALLEAQAAQSPRGTLAVGVIPTVAPYLLPLLLPEMEARYPEIKLRLFEMQTSAVVEALGRDEIDLGVLAIPLDLPQIHAKRLYTEPFAVLCQTGHPLAKGKRVKPGALDARDVWLLEEGHCLRNQVLDVCALRGGTPSTRRYQFESGSIETLKNLVDAYGGYTLLPDLAAASIGANSVVVPFAAPVPARDIGLVYVREHYKRELQEAFEKAVLEAVPKALKKAPSATTHVLPVRSS